MVGPPGGETGGPLAGGVKEGTYRYRVSPEFNNLRREILRLRFTSRAAFINSPRIKESTSESAAGGPAAGDRTFP